MDTPSSTEPRADEHLLSPQGGWVVVAAATAGIVATYWDDGWHTKLGRDSTFIPPHLLLYGSMAVIGAVLAWWVFKVLLSTRSLRAAASTPGLALTAAAGTTVAGAAPVDAVWHAAFGRDSVLWSPPHLVSVIGTIALIVGASAGISAPRSAAVRLGLGAALLGGTQLVLLEYDTNVPQFSETLYLPVLLAATLAAAWAIRALIGTRFDVTSTVGLYLVTRAAILAVIAAANWPAPSWPLALLGLAVLDGPARWGATRWPLAGLAMTLLQLIASASGISSVRFGSVVSAATVVVPVLVAVLIATTPWRRAAPATLTTIALLAAPIMAAPQAHAHDPGQGPLQGTALLTIVGDGNGTLSVQAGDFNSIASDALEPGRLVARRAGQTVTGMLHAKGDGVSGMGFEGRIALPSRGRWIVYVELRDHDRVLEAWLPVQQNTTASVSERRPVYLPAGTGPRPVGEYLAGSALIGITVILLGWSAVAVASARRRRDQTSVATLSDL